MKTFKNWSCSTVIWCKLGLGCSEVAGRLLSVWSQGMDVVILLGLEAP